MRIDERLNWVSPGCYRVFLLVRYGRYSGTTSQPVCASMSSSLVTLMVESSVGQGAADLELRFARQPFSRSWILPLPLTTYVLPFRESIGPSSGGGPVRGADVEPSSAEKLRLRPTSKSGARGHPRGVGLSSFLLFKILRNSSQGRNEISTGLSSRLNNLILPWGSLRLSLRQPTVQQLRPETPRHLPAERRRSQGQLTNDGCVRRPWHVDQCSRASSRRQG